MIYFGSFFAGIINGLFTSGAGQILVFILIFVLKEETHKARGTSVFLVSIITIFTLLRYLTVININFKDMIIVALSGGLGGYLGSKIMKKISSVCLNVISGMLILGLALYSLIRG